MKKTIFLFALTLAVFACDNDDETNTTPEPAAIEFNFTQNFGSQDNEVVENDLNTTVYTNANGEDLTISRLRYLISNIAFVNSANERTEIDGYYFKSITSDPSEDISTLTTGVELEPGTYTLSFTYGFIESDNGEGVHPALNQASWNWPTMLGGGYHFLQMDGLYNVDTDAPAPFNFHNGTARPEEGVFEANHLDFAFNNIVIDGDKTITFTMDIAEWFVNPNTWDLNELDTPLMPNYMAQIMMNENAGTVFSVRVE